MRPWHHRNLDSCPAFSCSSPSYLLFTWDLSTRGWVRAEEGLGQGGPAGPPSRPPSLTSPVAFLEEMPFGKRDLWGLGNYQQLRHVGPLERKTPLDAGKVEYSFIFYCVWVWGGARVLASLCVAEAWTQENSGNTSIRYMPVKVNTGILFAAVVGGGLWRGGSAAVETAWKLQLSLCFQEHVTFWEKRKKISIELTYFKVWFFFFLKKQLGKLELKLIPPF